MRLVQLAFRVLEMIVAAGILFLMIVITEVSLLTAWVMRITVSRNSLCLCLALTTYDSKILIQSNPNTGRRSSDPLCLRNIPSCAASRCETPRVLGRLPDILRHI